MENSTVTQQDVATIREWISKEAYLPQDIDDMMLRKFLNSCYRSLEATKKCIERFALGRANMKEIYTSRDPFSEQIKTAFSITSVVTFEADKYELLIHQMDDPALEKFSFYDLLKAFTIQADYWLRYHEYKEFPEGHIIVLDIKDYHLRIIPKVNIMYFRDFLLFLLVNDMMLRKFLNSCYRSLEATKKCIERFALGRANMKEIYTSRDPFSEQIKTAFSITSVVTFEADKYELLIHQMDDPALEKFSFYDLLKAFTIQADYWLRYHEYKEFPEGHIIVLDIKDYHLRIIPKVNIMYFRDFLLFLLESMPVRVKQVHVVNCPSYYEKLYALVKPVLPAEILNIIKFHGDTVGISKYIDKKYLPKDYGGEQPSLKDEQKRWVYAVNGKRSMFLDDSLWTADLKKKPKSNADNNMNGSFRTLSID